MKQQFTGSYTLDVASRTIVLSGIEIPPERLAVVINSTVGFVYHNIEQEPVAQVSIAPNSTGGLLSAVNYDAIGGFDGDYTLYQDGLDKGGVINIVGGVITGVVNPGDGYSAGFANTVGGTRFVVTIDPSYNTVVVFPAYKDCETHRNSDSLSIFYDDGIDLGQLIKDESDETQALLQAEFDETQAAITDFRTEVKAEFDATQALLQTEFTDTRSNLTDFRTEVKAESDETQALLQAEFDETQAAITDFRTEVKAESDETQALLQTEFTDTRSNLTDFRTEVKAESDETQALLQVEFDETQTAITDFRTEVKAESDETQALLQAEFDNTRTAITDFRTEVKAESDETQSLLQTEFDQTQTLLNEFKTQAKDESDATQTLLQTEFDQTQTLLTEFKTQAKAESDATQALLGDKLPALAEGMVLTEFLNFLEPPNDVDVSYVGHEPARAIYGPDGRRYISGGYGPARIIYSRAGVTLRVVNLYYGDSGDALGKLVLVTPALWTPAELTTRNAWFDASFADSITEVGGEISAWRDRTSNGFTLITPSGVTAPRVGALLSDYPTVAFDAGGNYLQSRLNGSIRSLTNLPRNTLYSHEAIFIVARNKSDVAGSWLFSMGINMNPNDTTRIISDEDVPDRLLWRSSGILTDQVRYDLPGWSGVSKSHLLGFFKEGATSQIFEAGQLVGQTATTGTPRAGGWDRVGLTSNADFAEMLFLSEVPNEPTRQRIEGYLAHKWGLADQLPPSHPHRFLSPGI